MQKQTVRTSSLDGHLAHHPERYLRHLAAGSIPEIHKLSTRRMPCPAITTPHPPGVGRAKGGDRLAPCTIQVSAYLPSMDDLSCPDLTSYKWLLDLTGLRRHLRFAGCMHQARPEHLGQPLRGPVRSASCTSPARPHQAPASNQGQRPVRSPTSPGARPPRRSRAPCPRAARRAAG